MTNKYTTLTDKQIDLLVFESQFGKLGSDLDMLR